MKEKEAEREMNRTDAGEDTGMKDPEGKRKIQGVEEQPEELAAACLGYFRERPILGRLLEGFWEKYLSYGKFAGTVTVRILTESERMDLEGFLQRNYHGKKTASVSARRFEEALAGSRFAGIGGKEALELYFALLDFQKKSELYDDHYVTLLYPSGYDLTVSLYCRDPSALVDQALRKGRSAVLFSATFSPMGYYQAVLGSEENCLGCRLPSPFPQENLGLFINDRISTRYQDRETTYDAVAENLYALVAAKKGNYMLFFPSYSYCRQVYERFCALCGEEIRPVIQQSGMTEEEREQFLMQFEEERPQSLAAFCVLGGIFSEGIDLKGSRLIGAAIVGVGLPQIGPEPDAVRDYYQEKNGMGFDFAYRFPGMNKVLQAAGRVIRDMEDRGAVLLIDQRFTQPAYQNLFPAHWSHWRRVRTSEELSAVLIQFWNNIAKNLHI